MLRAHTEWLSANETPRPGTSMVRTLKRIPAMTFAAVLAGLVSAPPIIAQQWKRCSLRGAGDTLAQCTSIPVPLDHHTADGRTLSLAVKRVPAPGVERRQVWFVDGGPGDAGRASLGRV